MQDIFSWIGAGFNYVITNPLGYILYGCYYVTRNYGLAILLFTLVTRVLLFPLAIKQQKSSAEMMRLQPKLTALTKKYGKDKQKLQEEQMKLYSDEGYNPFGGCLPLLIQMPILIALYNVIYQPYTYMIHLSQSTIRALVTAVKSGVIAASGKAFTSSATVDAIMKNRSNEIFLAHALKGHQDIFAQITHISLNIDFNFLGLDLTQNPDMHKINILILIPIICYLTSLLSSWMSMKITQMPQQPGSPNVSGMNKSMIVIMPLISAFISLTVPAGVGFYWICTNVFMILQVLILNKFYNTQKLAELAEIEAQKRKAKRNMPVAVQPEEPDTEEDVQGGEVKNTQQKKPPAQHGTSGNKTKKQLMEENRRRLAAARQKEKRKQ